VGGSESDFIVEPPFAMGVVAIKLLSPIHPFLTCSSNTMIVSLVPRLPVCCGGVILSIFYVVVGLLLHL